MSLMGELEAEQCWYTSGGFLDRKETEYRSNIPSEEYDQTCSSCEYRVVSDNIVSQRLRD